MPRLLLLGLLTVLTLGSACQRFRHQFDAVASQCGVDPASIQADELFIKFVTPQGEELGAETLLTMRSRFLSASRRTEGLPISNRGCVRIKAESGVVQAFSSVQGWSASHTLSEPQARHLLRVSMTNSPRVIAELQCPTAGFFANEALTFPLRWTSDGPMNSARLTLTAVDAVQQKSFVLFEKPYGLHLNNLPESLQTANLPEGSYQLQLSFQLSTEGWDIPGQVPSRIESCPLIVLHAPPKLGGLDGYALEQGVAVFDKGQALPWKTNSKDSELVHCREKRALDLDELDSTDAGCEARAHCRQIENFQKTGAIVPDEAGVFDYYAYAEDKAGNRSAMSCQTVVVTDSKPNLKVLWSDDSWNKPASQMDTPRWDVQLRVAGRHPQLSDAALPTRYQCRAEFLRDDQAMLSGSSILCTSGRCRHKSLEKYVPCDADLNLSLAHLWPHLRTAGGVLRVFVRADDGTGRSEEQMATVGLRPRRWEPMRLSPGDTLEHQVNQLLQDAQARIFGVKYQTISRLNETTREWEQLPITGEPAKGSIRQAWLSQEGELHAQWVYRTAGVDQDLFQIYRWSTTGWEPLPGLDADSRMECLRPQSFHRGGFWCDTAGGPAFFRNGEWTRFSLGEAEGAACKVPPHSQTLVQDEQGSFWLRCSGQLLEKRKGQDLWVVHQHALPLLNIGIDGKERLWILRGTERDDLQIQLTEKGTSRLLPIPETYNWVDVRPEEFRITADSVVILGDAYWDDGKNQWQVFPYFRQRRVDQRVTAHFLATGELYWQTEQGYLQWDGKGLRHWDLSVYGLGRAPQGQLVVSQNSAPIILAGMEGSSYLFPYQFQMVSWIYFPKPGASAQSSVAGLWVDELSIPRVYVSGEGLFEVNSGRWTRTIHSPNLAEEWPLESQNFEPYLLSPKGVYRYTEDQGWSRIIYFPETRYYWGGVRDSRGRFWLYQDSMELGLIDGTEFHSVSLPPEAGSEIRGIFNRREGPLVATDVGLMSRREDDSGWNMSTWQDWGLTTIDQIRRVDDDTYFVSVTEDGGAITELWLLDMKTQTKKAFKLPPDPFFLRNIQRTSQGDYIVGFKFAIYRTDGSTYSTIFSQKDLYSTSGPGTFLNIFRLTVDANDRAWFDTSFGVFRIDL
jgi:hypothetical protein